MSKKVLAKKQRKVSARKGAVKAHVTNGKPMGRPKANNRRVKQPEGTQIYYGLFTY